MLVSGRSGGRPALSRRAALGAAVLLATTGCGLDAGSSPSSGGASRSTSSAPSTAASEGTSGEASANASPDTDLVLLDQTRTAINTVLALVVATQQAKPTLRRPLGGLQRMHQAHLDALETASPTPSPSASEPTPKAPAAAGSSVRSAVSMLERREDRLRQVLADASLAAASGEFARLLASMSAGLAQHLTQLPRVP